LADVQAASLTCPPSLPHWGIWNQDRYTNGIIMSPALQVGPQPLVLDVMAHRRCPLPGFAFCAPQHLLDDTSALDHAATAKALQDAIHVFGQDALVRRLGRVLGAQGCEETGAARRMHEGTAGMQFVHAVG
jgi:hypothetical protein